MTVKNEPLPEGWREVKLKEVANLRNGKYQPSDSLPVRCIELEHLEKNSGRIIGEIDAGTQNSTKNIFKAGDVLFGKLRPYLRKFGLPKFNGVCSSEIWAFVSNTDLITNKYLFYSLQTGCFINSACKTTGTKMPRADWNFVQNVPVALPPLSEQKAIASLLEKWDTAIEKTEALIEAKEKRFKWLLKTLISDQQDNSEWQKMKLGEICTFEYGKPLKEQDRIGDQYPVFGSNGIVGRHNEYLVAGPFIVVGRKGSAGTVSYSMSNGFPIDTTFYINLQSGEIHLRFLYYLLLHVELDRISAQSGVPGLNRNDAYKISISIPSSVEQKGITRTLDAGNREIDLLNQLAEKYRTQKRGLMQKLLTGKWRVKPNTKARM